MRPQIMAIIGIGIRPALSYLDWLLKRLQRSRVHKRKDFATQEEWNQVYCKEEFSLLRDK